jgi:hypothetical protein
VPRYGKFAEGECRRREGRNMNEAHSVVVEDKVTRVEVCPCGGCYLTVGPITVTLHVAVVEELRRTLNRALKARDLGGFAEMSGPTPHHHQ